MTIPKRYMQRPEGKVIIVNAGDQVKLIPVPKDPISALKGAFSVKKPFAELRRQAEAEARKAIARS